MTHSLTFNLNKVIDDGNKYNNMWNSNIVEHCDIFQASLSYEWLSYSRTHIRVAAFTSTQNNTHIHTCIRDTQNETNI